MIRPSRAALLTLVLALLGPACYLDTTDRIEGSGNVVTETRAVSGFSAIDFRSEGEVTIVQGDTESLTIATDDNLMQYLDTRVEDGTLIIETSNEPDVDIDPSDTVSWVVEVRDIQRLRLSGAGDLGATALEGEALELTVAGAMDVEVAELTLADLDVVLTGAGSIDLAGSTQTLSVILSGAGTIDLGGLSSEEADVVISGAGDVTVRATDGLDATISGAGNIRYLGDPEVRQRITGTGSIRPAE